MTPTYGLLHDFQLALKHENDPDTPTHHSRRKCNLADGQKLAAKHLIKFFYEKQLKLEQCILNGVTLM